jgi:maltooligosyltrehalose trehalohydrolase
MELRVWAPRAHSVQLDVDGRRSPLAPRSGGWWALPAPGIAPGTDYTFILDGVLDGALDGGEPLADPRTRWQPRGAFGPSRALDHGAFRWSDAGWQPPELRSGVIYELHVGTFSPEGTFEGAIARLDHLAWLGITHVELMPVADFPGTRGWGYDGVHLGAPHEAYGGPEGLKRFVDACHARGLAVLMDVVFNHLGPAGAVLERFGPYFTERHHTPWGRAVNLDDEGSDEVRRFLCDVALQWLEDYHCDGLRLDAVHALFDSSAVHVLEQLSREVELLQERLGRRLVLIAESEFADPRLIRSRAEHGWGLDARWNDDFHHALHVALTGENSGYYAGFQSFAGLGRILHGEHGDDGGHAARLRARELPVVAPTADRLVGFSQNHDQVGNRAQGERTAALVDRGGLCLAAALVLTAPFVPMLFMGEEWAASTPFLYFTDHEDPELGRAVSEGRRRDFLASGRQPDEVPDPQAPESFQRSRLLWEERSQGGHASMLAWYRDLVHLRRDNEELHDGCFDRTTVSVDEARRHLIMRRGRFLVACNFADHALDVKAPAPAQLLLASDAAQLIGDTLAVPPRSVAVLRCGDSDATRAVAAQAVAPRDVQRVDTASPADVSLPVTAVPVVTSPAVAVPAVAPPAVGSPAGASRAVASREVSPAAPSIEPPRGAAP